MRQQTLLLPSLLCALAQSYMLTLLKSYEVVRPLRSSGSHILAVPRVNSKSSEAAFSFNGPRCWNSLPEDLKCAQSLISLSLLFLFLIPLIFM